MQSPKKRNLDQNINDSKSHIWSSFFLNIISGIKHFYICPEVPVDIIRVFFNFRFSGRKFQIQQKQAKKITHFTIHFCSKNLTHFTNTAKDLSDFKNFPANMFLFGVRKNICTTPFLDAQELHS